MDCITLNVGRDSRLDRTVQFEEVFERLRAPTQNQQLISLFEDDPFAQSARLLQSLEKTKLSNFVLPQNLCEYFDGVTTGKDGRFTEQQNVTRPTMPTRERNPRLERVCLYGPRAPSTPASKTNCPGDRRLRAVNASFTHVIDVKFKPFRFDQEWGGCQPIDHLREARNLYFQMDHKSSTSRLDTK